MDPQNIASPLIVDPDLDFLHRLKSHPMAKNIPPVAIHSEREANSQLSNPEHRFSGLFVNPRVADPLGVPVIRLVLKLRPNLPIYMLTESASETPASENLRRLMVRQVLCKPITYAEILGVVQHQQVEFNQKTALEIAAQNKDTLDSDSGAKGDDDFVPILAANFFAGAISFFDVYVRLKADKFVKVLQAGDAFSKDRIETYLKKGVLHFFLRKEAQEGYLQYCDKLAGAVLKSTKVKIEIKAQMVANQGQEALSFLRQRGLSATALQHAEGFVNHVRIAVDCLGPKKNVVLGKFLEDMKAYDHGVATTMISALLMQPLNFGAEKSVQLIGLASLLHDIGLQEMPPKFLDEDEENMDVEELALFHQHPMIGSQMISKIKGIDPSVIQAIEQHHERRTRTGFPNRIGAGALNRIVEIVGISQEFVHLIQKADTPRADGRPPMDPMTEMQRLVFDGFSSQIGEAFKMVFLP